MKKFQLLTVSLSFAAFTLFGCGSDAAEVSLDWDGNKGNLEVVNTSNTDIVLFVGDRPTDSGLMGGVRAGATRTIDICKHVGDDCGVGGWTIIRGITRDVYNDNIHNLTGITKIDFSAMATYKSDMRYRITIDYNTVGENAVRLVNRGRVGMELRKDSPEGEKVAYLPALQQNQMMYAQTTNGMTLFPFYVLYNKSTQTVTTLKATDMWQSVQVSPRPATGNIMTYYFPNDATDSWEKLVGTLKSPVAYMKVDNGVMNQSAYFTASGATRLVSQNGYDDVAPGETPMPIFEVEAAEATKFKQKTVKDPKTEEDVEKDDLDEPIEGGIRKNLVAILYGGMIEVPVLFYHTDGTTPLLDDGKDPITAGQTPVTTIYNGYDYTVSIEGSGQNSKDYKAVIKRGKKRDLSDQLEAL